MLLCDIGNTSYHFYDGVVSYKKSVLDFEPKTLEQKVYFISVNAQISQRVASLENWINLEACIDRKNYYATMGIDRIVALEAISCGVIVDAGSAITVDVIDDGVFLGGFIFAGVRAMSACYRSISPALSYDFNFDLDLDKLPKNSQDAISYGYLKPFYSEVMAFNLPIILTGGDAHRLKKLFKNAVVDELLLFKGMQRLIQRLHKTLSNV